MYAKKKERRKKPLYDNAIMGRRKEGKESVKEEVQRERKRGRKLSTSSPYL